MVNYVRTNPFLYCWVIRATMIKILNSRKAMVHAALKRCFDAIKLQTNTPDTMTLISVMVEFMVSWKWQLMGVQILWFVTRKPPHAWEWHKPFMLSWPSPFGAGWPFSSPLTLVPVAILKRRSMVRLYTRNCLVRDDGYSVNSSGCAERVKPMYAWSIWEWAKDEIDDAVSEPIRA